jgi:hypothetical protein
MRIERVRAGRTSKMAASARMRPDCAGAAAAAPPSNINGSTHAVPLICVMALLCCALTDGG